MAKTNLRKSVSTSFQVYHHVNSSSSDTSTLSSSSGNSDTPLKRFNRLLRSSVARHWTFFKRNQSNLRTRGRSISDAGLCSIVDNDLGYLDITAVSHRRSLQVLDNAVRATMPSLLITEKEVDTTDKNKDEDDDNTSEPLAEVLVKEARSSFDTLQTFCLQNGSDERVFKALYLLKNILNSLSSSTLKQTGITELF